MSSASSRRGVTLVEVLVYIALLSFLVGSSLGVVWQLLGGMGRDAARITEQEEGSFVIRKLDWALAGATAISVPSAGTPSATRLVIARQGMPHAVVVQLNAASSSVELQEDGGAFVPLTTQNVAVRSLTFTYLPARGMAPAGVAVSVNVDGGDFETHGYLPR